jgi:hypothetical protein
VAPEPREIDWSSAQVEESTLKIGLSGTNTKAWKSRFEDVIKLLNTPHSSWGAIRIAKDRVTVADVEQGGEPELRHFLDSAVTQTNADVSPPAEQDDGENVADSDNAQPESRDVPPDSDGQMTRAFQGLAEEA